MGNLQSGAEARSCASATAAGKSAGIDVAGSGACPIIDSVPSLSNNNAVDGRRFGLGDSFGSRRGDHASHGERPERFE